MNGSVLLLVLLLYQFHLANLIPDVPPEERVGLDVERAGLLLIGVIQGPLHPPAAAVVGLRAVLVGRALLLLLGGQRQGHGRRWRLRRRRATILAVVHGRALHRVHPLAHVLADTDAAAGRRQPGRRRSVWKKTGYTTLILVHKDFAIKTLGTL